MDLDHLENLNSLKQKKKAPKKWKARSEESEQSKVVSFLRSTYPHVLFRASPEGIKLSIGMATKLKRQGLLQKGLPDLEIFHPVGEYHGLFIEMKKRDTVLVLKNGNLPKNDHLDEQREILKAMNTLGYFASFALGGDHAIEIIKAYMNQENLQELQKI